MVRLFVIEGNLGLFVPGTPFVLLPLVLAGAGQNKEKSKQWIIPKLSMCM